MILCCDGMAALLMANSDPSHSPGPDSDPVQVGGSELLTLARQTRAWQARCPTLSLSSEKESVLTSPRPSPRARAGLAARKPALALPPPESAVTLRAGAQVHLARGVDALLSMLPFRKPSRRGVTPGLPSEAFARDESGRWRLGR